MRLTLGIIYLSIAISSNFQHLYSLFIHLNPESIISASATVGT